VIETTWRDLVIGDFVLLQDNERIPADLLVINNSNHDGRCYMETSTLDGEKNLKPREAIKKEPFCRGTVTIEDNNIEAEVDLHMRLNIKQPSYILYEFDGHLRYYDERDQLQTTLIGIDSKNLLLKGAKVKNTKWVIGLVLYTGKETKIQLNATTAKSKMSLMEQKLHRMIVAIFVAQTAMSIFASFGRPFLLLIMSINFKLVSFLGFVGETTDSANSYDSTASSFVEGFRYFLLLQTLIPISLIVNLEVVRMLQVSYLKVNYTMQCQEKPGCFSTNSASVNEELGQIEYILTDKTGTLTQNKMVLRGIFIGDCIFGGEFVEKDGKTTFDHFLDHEKRTRRLSDMEEAFDRRLAHAMILGDDAPLREPITISYQGIKTPFLEGSIQKSTLRGTRLSEKTLTHIIQYNGIDVNSESTIHKTIIKTRSEKNILLRSIEQPLKVEPSSSIITEKGDDEASIEDLMGERGPYVSKDDAIPFENLESKSSVLIPDSLPAETPSSGKHLVFGAPLEPLQEEGLILNSYQDAAVEFLMAASLCHDCVVERNVSQNLTYHGPSPDEIAICKGANLIGCKFLAKDSDGKCSLDMFGEQRSPVIKMVGHLN
jgi:magnesium-transporting ATPase (P-type)